MADMTMMGIYRAHEKNASAGDRGDEESAQRLERINPTVQRALGAQFIAKIIGGTPITYGFSSTQIPDYKWKAGLGMDDEPSWHVNQTPSH